MDICPAPERTLARRFQKRIDQYQRNLGIPESERYAPLLESKQAERNPVVRYLRPRWAKDTDSSGPKRGSERGELFDLS